MYQRTGRRFARSRVASGRVAHRQIYHERVSFLSTIGAGNITSFNLLTALEAYLGYNFTGTVLGIDGWFAFGRTTTGQLAKVGLALGVFAAELPTSTTMTAASVSTGNARYLPWMYHYQFSDPNAAFSVLDNQAWGYRSPQIRVRAKRRIKTIDQDLQSYVFNNGAASADYSGMLHIVLATA